MTLTSTHTKQARSVNTGVIKISRFTTRQNTTLKDINIFYHSWGKLNANRDNAIWICHGLTADSNAANWWPELIGPGKIFDTEHYFVICPNLPGSCYGSSQPAELVDSESEDKVQLEIKDFAAIFEQTAQKLGINGVYMLTGASIGGFIALEFAIQTLLPVKHLCLAATSYYASPWSIAINQAQLMALENPNNQSGLAVARAIAMLSYRNWKVYNRTQNTIVKNKKQNAATYQRYQGKKLAGRFSSESYTFLLRAFDTHDVGRESQPAEEVLGSLQTKTLVLGFSTDILFPVEEQKALAGMLPRATLRIVNSDFGHDAFLTETKIISNIIYHFLNE